MLAGLLLLLVLPASPPEPDHVAVAKRFLQAYREKDAGAQLVVAAERVSYALAVNYLLTSGETAAAHALADARQGPEHAALLRLCREFRRPTPEQFAALASAGSFLARGQPDEALTALVGAGDPGEASVFGVEVSWTRARALAVARRTGESVAETARCAGLAWACGWIRRARDAEKIVARAAPSLPERMAAVVRYIDACRKIDDEAGRLDAHELHARLLHAAARAAEPPDDAKLLREMRAEYVEAIDLARRLGEREKQAALLAVFAYHWQEEEHQPKQALKFYREAESILNDLGREDALRKVRLNMTTALTSTGAFREALVRLELLMAGAEPPYDEIERRALGQRAYVLTRQGTLERAAEAFDVVLAVEPPGPRRVQWLVEAAEVQFQRGDLRAAVRRCDEALQASPGHVGALVGRARARARGGDEQGAREDFEAAVAGAGSADERMRAELMRAAEFTFWGRVPEALAALRRTIASFKESEIGDYANAAGVWVFAADLALRTGDTALGLKLLANAGSFCVRINQTAAATTAYAREILLLVSRGEMEAALMRLQVLRNIAGASSSPGLEGLAKCAEAIFEARAGRIDEARTLLDEARDLAVAAGDEQLHATVLLDRAMLDPPGTGLERVEQALSVLDARRTRGAEDHPFVEGERADHAAGVGLHLLLRAENPPAATALRYLERAKAERLQVALRGREALLAAALEPALHDAYVTARGRLVEARVEDRGIAEAEAAFDETVARLHREAPDVAALAFPPPVDLAAVQAALREGEALVLMLDDPYARAILAIGRKRTRLAEFDRERPLDAVADVLEGKQVVLAAADGMWAARPLATAPFGEGMAVDRFRFFYVVSAADFLRRRDAPPAPAGRGLAIEGDAPVKATATGAPALLHVDAAGELELEYPQASRLDTNVPGLLRHPRPVATLVAPSTRPRPTARPRAEGVTVIVAALGLAGARDVVVSLSGPAPNALLQRFYANCLDKGLSPATALHEAQQWLRRGDPELEPSRWAGLVLFGVP